MARFVNQTRDNLIANTGDPALWARLGMVCEANGLLAPARASYVQAIAMDPAQAKWEYRLAVVDTLLGDSASAMSHIDRAIELEPRFAPLHWRRGLWLLDEGRFQEAEAAFRRALVIDPQDRAARLGLARTFLLTDRPADSLTETKGLLADAPGDRYALQLLGSAQRRLGHLEEAETALTAGIEGVAVWSDAWSEELTAFQYAYGTLLARANALVAIRNLTEAGRIYEQLRLRRPDDLDVANKLAETYLGSGRVDAALELLGTILPKAQDNPQTHMNMASALVNKGHAAAALEHAQRAVDLNGGSAPAHQTLGLAQWKAGRADAALHSLAAAQALDKRNPTLLIWRGLILRELGRAGPALAAFREAAGDAPGLIDAWLGLGMMHMAAGNVADAEAALDRAARLDPRHPQVIAGLEKLQGLKASRSIGRTPPSRGDGR